MVLRHRSFRLLYPHEDQGEEEEAFTVETSHDRLLRDSRQEAMDISEPVTDPITSSSVGKTSGLQAHHQELLGTVLELPEAKTPHQLMLEMYADMNDRFGDSLSGRMPINWIRDFYHVKIEEKFVSLADDDSHKTGEEMLQAFLTVSREEAERRRANGNGDDDDDNRSDRSDRSSRSDRSDSDDLISPFLGDSKITVSTTLSDPSMGIKLKIRKLPKPELPPPEPEVPKEPEKSPEKMEVEPTETKQKQLWKPTHQLSYNEAFEYSDMSFKVPTVFSFRYVGTFHRCEYLRKIKTMFDEVTPPMQLMTLNRLLKPVGKTFYGKRSTPKKTAAIHSHQSSLYSPF